MAETAEQKKARLAAAAREAAYIASLSNPITSQNDPRIAANAGFNPDMAATQMTSSGQTPTDATVSVTDPTVVDPTVVEPTVVDPTVVEPTVTKKVVSTYIDPNTGDVVNVFDDGTEVITKKGTKGIDDAAAAAAAKAGKRAEGQSAFDLLRSEFGAFGMGGLVEPLQQFIQEGISRDEFVLRLRNTDAYKKRFAANAQRVAKGLRALSEAEYIGMEDQYQNVMRQYGLPESYYARGDMGRQEGFEKFLAGDVSAVELEDRISTAQNRVVNSNPEVSKALKEFYPGISNGDILAYVLDPTNAIENIKRKVTAAEIGGAAYQSGLQTGMVRAEELGAAGITKAQAQQGFGTIAGGLQRGSQLASIYGESPYTQTTAEQEVFNIAGAQESRKQRQKITGLEKAAFGGQSGLSSSALARDRAGAY
jgi:hypothetical protein